MTDRDDTFAGYVNKLRPKNESVQTPQPAPQPALPPALTHHAADGREAYEAFYEPFENEVRTTSVEIRCNRKGWSYFIQYAHMSAILFRFREEDAIFFSGGGYGVEIQGRNLRHVMLSLRLHACGTIQDFVPEYFVQPEPVNPTAAFVESITVEVLQRQKPEPSNTKSKDGKFEKPEAGPNAREGKT